MTTLAEKIAIMQAFERGEKIECAEIGCGWSSTDIPIWDWEGFEYRIAQPEPKKVLLIAWIDGDGELRTVTDPAAVPKEWIRVPELDKEITLP